ncbi:YciI family protein [Cupriavidus necator]
MNSSNSGGKLDHNRDHLLHWRSLLLFAVRFHDKPEQLLLRSTYLQAHIDWLRQHRESILIAGSLRDAPDAGAVGGLWIVRASNRSEIESLIQSDPFWIHGLRERVEIHSWHRAFDELVTL